jgi:hypothetical protein
VREASRVRMLLGCRPGVHLVGNVLWAGATPPAWPPTRCATTPPGTDTSPWPCSPTPTCPPPAPPRKRGVRSRKRPAHRTDRALTPAPTQHAHLHLQPRPRRRRRRRLVLVAPTTPSPSPRRPLPSRRTSTAITAVAVRAGRVGISVMSPPPSDCWVRRPRRRIRPAMRPWRRSESATDFSATIQPASRRSACSRG